MDNQQEQNEELPVTHNKDAEFSQEIADEDDFEALHRAELAEQRNKVDVNYNDMR
jgi:hypothetical protein